MTHIQSHRAMVEDQLIFWHEAPNSTEIPTLYLHGVPSCADDWKPFLEKTGGLAPDFPGFGRSVKHDPQQSTMQELSAFIQRFVHARNLEKINLVVHDWGGIGLLYAMQFPQRIHRLVVMNAITFLPGYRWHFFARIWRTPVLGELSVSGMQNPLNQLLAKHIPFQAARLPQEILSSVKTYAGKDTQQAILALYRSADEQLIAQESKHLANIDVPTLVLWGERDPYVSSAFGYAFCDALPQATLKMLPEAGHWPWLDQPDVVDTVSDFLTAS